MSLKHLMGWILALTGLGFLITWGAAGIVWPSDLSPFLGRFMPQTEYRYTIPSKAVLTKALTASFQSASSTLFFKTSSTSSLPAIDLRFVGDLMLDRGVKQAVLLNANGDYNFAFVAIPDLKKGADLLFGNLEGPISDQGELKGSAYSFRMDPAVSAVLKKQGFDILNVANNHAGDWGIEAFVDTLKHLKADGLAYTGGGLSWTEAATPTVIERQGFKVGFLGFSDVGPNWLAARGNTAGVLTIGEEKNFSVLISQAAAKVDVLVVSFHFGEEYQTEPTPRQEELARLAIDRGAKLVIGHHPHVIQKVERYKDGLIAYSLGNFIFDQYFSPATMKGLVLDVVVDKTGIQKVTERTVTLNNYYQPSWSAH